MLRFLRAMLLVVDSSIRQTARVSQTFAPDLGGKGAGHALQQGFRAASEQQKRGPCAFPSGMLRIWTTNLLRAL